MDALNILKTITGITLIICMYTFGAIYSNHNEREPTVIAPIIPPDTIAVIPVVELAATVDTPSPIVALEVERIHYGMDKRSKCFAWTDLNPALKPVDCKYLSNRPFNQPK